MVLGTMLYFVFSWYIGTSVAIIVITFMVQRFLFEDIFDVTALHVCAMVTTRHVCEKLKPFCLV